PDFKNGCSKEGLRFTWLGHSSSVIQIGGKTVLIDPVLSQRCSPVRFAGPKRFSQLPLKAEDLPAADAVFLSHDHYDHLDYHLIKTIKDKTGMFVVPLGLDAVLLNWGIPQEKITALDWWQSAEINGLSFTLTPSQHFTGRNPLRRNAVLWGGLYLKDENHSVYFTGDGGYNNVFTEVRGRLGSPELMIAECGQYDPAWASMHMFPEQTVQAALDVNASLVIPVHWGSYCICNHAWDDSITRFVLAAKKAGISISVPQIGQSADYEQLKGLKERWWQRYG
ncbi:MAG: MBL fold metallo-hydrolase, partial [Erysipelotrichaceae bacterium]|nr:MBL fold metallo-hydrolase [Erysipelotrichaceae bacterium]